jgi:hypothetical protein
LRSGVLAVMRTKLDAVGSDEVAAVEAMRDEQTLTELLIVLSCAADASEVRTALTAARQHA